MLLESCWWWEENRDPVTSADLVCRARRYYDANTLRFLRYGQGGSLGVIRRSVWAPSVRTEPEASVDTQNRPLIDTPKPAIN